MIMTPELRPRYWISAGGSVFEQWCSKRAQWFTAEQQQWVAIDPISAGEKRPNEPIGVEEDKLNMQFRDGMDTQGKDKKTRRQYSSGEPHWNMCMEQKGWSPYLTDLTYSETADRITYFAAREARKYKLDMSSVRFKLSVVRWMHVRDRRPDPMKGNATFTDWLADFGKHRTPPEPKVGVPVQLLEYIGMHLDCETGDLNACAINSAMKNGFWYLMRSIEYLTDDADYFDVDRSFCEARGG